MGFVARVCQPSTLRMLICPEASSAQNNIAAVSADGRTVCVLIRRLNSSCKRSIAFVVRKLFASSSQALVKVRVRIDDVLFVDYLSYHLIGGAWLVTAKSFHIERRFEATST